MNPASLTLRLAALATAVLLAPHPALASPATATESAFDAANQLYGEGKFAEAASAYQNLIRSGRISDALYFNLGNAFYKAGEIGRAIAAYRQAEQIAPRDPDLRANLRFVREQVQGPTHVPDRWHRWLGRLTVNEWTALTTAALWLCLLALAVIQFRPPLKRAFRNLALCGGVAVLALAICLTAVLTARAGATAIVVAPEAPVRNGPFDEFQNTFTAHDGAEFLVVDQKNDWFQVSADNGKTGWIKRDQVLLAPGG